MNRKISVVLLIMIFILVLFCGCSTVKHIEAETTSSTTVFISEKSSSTEQVESTVNTSAETTTTETTDDSDAQSKVETTVTTISPDTTHSNQSDTEEKQKLTDDPSYWFIWSLDEEGIANAENDPETIKQIAYDGKPVTVFCKLKNASAKPWEFGLFIEIEGVLQEIEVDGTKSEVYRFELQSLETRTVKMQFTPNIGKKGDINSLSCAVLLSPSYVAPESGSYGIYLEPGVSGNYPLVMLSDSTSTAETSDEASLYKISEINETIYSIYDEGNNLDDYENYPCCYVYEKLNDYIAKESGTIIRNTKITTKASNNSKLILNLHGKPGTYRVSFYINGERLNAFDGKGYIDVTIGKHQQAEIPVTIDTRKLKGANRIEAYYKEINCDYTKGDVLASSSAQKYIVK